MRVFVFLVIILFTDCKNERVNNFEIIDIQSISNEPFATIDNEVDSYPDCFDSIVKNQDKQGFGCGNAFIFKSVDEGLVTIYINLEKVSLKGKCQELNLNQVDIGLEVYRNNKNYRDSIKSIDYCSCTPFVNSQSRVETKFISGKIIASAKKKTEEENIYQPEKYNTEYISAKLTDLKFLHPISEDTIRIEEVIFYNVEVGWAVG
ncbi:MAG: hypothetical protein ABF242_01650 [Flavobacteriales bacterium]